jgi:hypothetical protein
VPEPRKSGSAGKKDIDRLLRESAALRARSNELAAEVERLRKQLAAIGLDRVERRKKPRLKGK